MADKYLLINADDFGMCDSANRAVMDLFKSGNLLSSTIMMPCKAAKDAVQFSIDNPQYAIGIHLTMTSEWKNYKWGPLTDGKSLVTPEGHMWPESDDFEKHCDYAEVEKEIRAQIEMAENMGMKPSHVDNHMGSLYGLNGKLKLLPKTLKICGEKGYAFRMCSKPLKSQCPPEVSYALYAGACRVAGFLGKIYKVPMPDYLIFPEWTNDKKVSYEQYREIILNEWTDIPNGITETYVHPAFATEEMKGITATWLFRSWEYEVLKDPVTHQHLQSHGIKLISYPELIKIKG